MTLTEFLLTRIADDEHFGTHDRHLAKRWDAECEAKRRIVDEHWAYDDTGTCNVCTDIARGVSWPCPTLRFLALPYADHPDYREEWRP